MRKNRDILMFFFRERQIEHFQIALINTSVVEYHQTTVRFEILTSLS